METHQEPNRISIFLSYVNIEIINGYINEIKDCEGSEEIIEQLKNLYQENTQLNDDEINGKLADFLRQTYTSKEASNRPVKITTYATRYYNFLNVIFNLFREKNLLNQSKHNDEYNKIIEVINKLKELCPDLEFTKSSNSTFNNWIRSYILLGANGIYGYIKQSEDRSNKITPGRNNELAAHKRTIIQNSFISPLEAALNNNRLDDAELLTTLKNIISQTKIKLEHKEKEYNHPKGGADWRIAHYLSTAEHFYNILKNNKLTDIPEKNIDIDTALILLLQLSIYQLEKFITYDLSDKKATRNVLNNIYNFFVTYSNSSRLTDNIASEITTEKEHLLTMLSGLKKPENLEQYDKQVTTTIAALKHSVGQDRQGEKKTYVVPNITYYMPVSFALIFFGIEIFPNSGSLEHHLDIAEAKIKDLNNQRKQQLEIQRARAQYNEKICTKVPENLFLIHDNGITNSVPVPLTTTMPDAAAIIYSSSPIDKQQATSVTHNNTTQQTNGKKKKGRN